MTEQGLSTSAIASASGYSVQQIRNLESIGVIAAVERSANGYRRFTVAHPAQLAVYRDLADAVGPVEARQVLREVRVLSSDRAVARVGGLHIRLAAERDLAIGARRALLAIGTEPTAPYAPADVMTITQLAEGLGVRTSALRFWEKEGLLQPERITTRAGTARRYHREAIEQARIIAALRAAGYRIPELRPTMATVRRAGPTREALVALDARLAAIARRTMALLRAGAGIAEIIASGGQR